MPDFRKLTAEEVRQMQSRRGRSVDLSAYLASLRELQPGDMGEATLRDGEKKATVKRRLTSAAKQLGMSLKYRRSGGDRVTYEIGGR